MKRKEKKPSRRKPSASKTSRDRIRAGGDVVGGDKQVAGGDIVGRDKIQAGQYVARLTNINLPRSVQIAIGAASVAIVALAIWLITRPSGIVNGSFESGTLDGWAPGGAVQVIRLQEPVAPPDSQYAAALHIGASVQQTVTLGGGQPQLTVWYRSPSGADSGTLVIYVNDQRQPFEAALAAAQAPDWNVAVADLSENSGKPVTLRIEYAAPAGRGGGRLLSPPEQSDDVLWIDNIAIIEKDEAAKIVQPAPTALPTPAPTSTPARAIPAGPLSLSFTENGKACIDSTYYNVVFSLTAKDGTPAYTYYRDVEQVGGPTRTGITYTLRTGENTAAVGTFFVVDSAGQRAEAKFYSAALSCP